MEKLAAMQKFDFAKHGRMELSLGNYLCPFIPA